MGGSETSGMLALLTRCKVRRRLLSRFVDEEEIDAELWWVDGTIVRAAGCAAGRGKK